MHRTHKLSLAGLVALLGVLVAIVAFTQPTLAPSEVTSTADHQYKDLVQVTSPTTGDKITSPLHVTGRARGGWYFEANFPVYLLDASGKEIAVGVAQAQGSWMTSEYVPFSTVLNFDTQLAGSRGTLVFKKDNPSGLVEHDDQFQLPITFR